MSTTTRKFKTVITDTGAKKLAQAAAPDGKPVRLTHMAVGDGGGTLPTPDSKQTRLVHEVWRHTVNRVILDATHQNRIIAELVIPPETGGFWIREIGVFDEHGDLIAVGNTAESYKPTVAEGSGRAQTFRTILTVSSTATVALTVDNTMVMATVDYVDDKLKEHEQSRRHPDASLTAKGFTQLSSATNSESETLAATPKAVKAAYDLANGKYTAQDATTARKGIVQLSSATNSTSETLAATPKAVKAAYDLANAKYTAQDATTARKGIVQLSSATNSTSETLAATPKAVKAVMDETNKKAPLNSPALTGTPTTPTAPKGTNNTQIASTAYVMAAIAALVDSSPDALNTLNELAAALGNDPNFATTMTNALAGKQPKDATLTALAGLATAADRFPYFTGNDVASLATLTKVGRDILAKSTVAAVIQYLGLRELGTSGEKIPLLSTANTWTNRQTFSGGLSGELSGNASTAAKLKTARKISNVAFDGSSDITLKASHVGAFALGKTGSTVANDKAVGWNWSSGAYNATIGGASTLILHFYMGEGSCPAAQFRINYKNGGIFYRSARDGYGFEADWSEFYTTTRKPSAGDVGALPLSGGQLNGALGIGTSSALGGNSIVLGDNDTGFKQNGDGNLDVYANNVHVMRFVSGSIQSNKTINITGRVNPSDYGNFDSRYVRDVRLGTRVVQTMQKGVMYEKSGHVITGLGIVGEVDGDDPAVFRPIQKLINGTWYNVSQV
ncbi:tail fiber protein [Escherichia coli]|uniref:tail fiber protein n=1 Tax=Escherichia coli TaxID=562 RepID=UPI001FF11AC1|nr:tail fiber protein [Escherichia coli]MCJ8490507.1 tail fiber protein [Escherichia coli]